MVFSLESGEHGESDVVTMSTGAGTGKLAARNAERWSDTAFKVTLVQPSGHGEEKGRQSPFLCQLLGTEFRD